MNRTYSSCSGSVDTTVEWYVYTLRAFSSIVRNSHVDSTYKVA